jgi:hypothetical protein
VETLRSFRTHTWIRRTSASSLSCNTHLASGRALSLQGHIYNCYSSESLIALLIYNTHLASGLALNCTCCSFSHILSSNCKSRTIPFFKNQCYTWHLKSTGRLLQLFPRSIIRDPTVKCVSALNSERPTILSASPLEEGPGQNILYSSLGEEGASSISSNFT